MSFEVNQCDLKNELAGIYAVELSQPLRVSISSPAFLAVNPLERGIKLLATELGGRLLDVGCGDQPYRTYLSRDGVDITACDYDGSKQGIDFACPADKIPTPDASFDSIFCTEVLEHVPEPAATLREFRRLLGPRGRVLLSTPCYWPSHELPYDYFRYPSHGLVHLFEANGFSVKRLLPRGGQWAFMGQVGAHVIYRHLSRAGLIGTWNRFFQFIDKKRCSPIISLGWTVVAEAE